jgi:hypothetical protein
MNKMHFIPHPPVLMGPDKTACGMEGYHHQGDEYDTATCDRFAAKLDDWKGVTCKRCLRSRQKIECLTVSKS